MTDDTKANVDHAREILEQRAFRLEARIRAKQSVQWDTGHDERERWALETVLEHHARISDAYGHAFNELDTVTAELEETRRGLAEWRSRALDAETTLEQAENELRSWKAELEGKAEVTRPMP